MDVIIGVVVFLVLAWVVVRLVVKAGLFLLRLFPSPEKTPTASPKAQPAKAQSSVEDVAISAREAVRRADAALAEHERLTASAPTKSSRKTKVKEAKHDVVQFDYVDAEGHFSCRRVVVNLFEVNYFEGIDADNHEVRTFRYDRIQGRVLMEETGELLEPEEWAYQVGGRLPPTPAPPEIVKEEVCFTGFKRARRTELETIASRKGLVVVGSVTVGLDYLVTGETAGPTKIRHAKTVGAELLTEAEFLARFGPVTP